jgi:hypothetical protein
LYLACPESSDGKTFKLVLNEDDCCVVIVGCLDNPLTNEFNLNVDKINNCLNAQSTCTYRKDTIYKLYSQEVLAESFNRLHKKEEFFPTAQKLQFHPKFRTLDQEFKDSYTIEDFYKINEFATKELLALLTKEGKLDEKKLIMKKEPDGLYFGQEKSQEEYIG